MSLIIVSPMHPIILLSLHMSRHHFLMDLAWSSKLAFNWSYKLRFKWLDYLDFTFTLAEKASSFGFTVDMLLCHKLFVMFA